MIEWLEPLWPTITRRIMPSWAKCSKPRNTPPTGPISPTPEADMIVISFGWLVSWKRASIAAQISSARQLFMLPAQTRNAPSLTSAAASAAVQIFVNIISLLIYVQEPLGIRQMPVRATRTAGTVDAQWAAPAQTGLNGHACPASGASLAGIHVYPLLSQQGPTPCIRIHTSHTWRLFPAGQVIVWIDRTWPIRSWTGSACGQMPSPHRSYSHSVP